VRDRPWRRHDLLEAVRRDIFRYLTPAATVERDVVQAAALLGMPASAVRALARVQFLACEEVKRLLEQLPFLLRQLATTTVAEEEWSTDRVRGAIQWGKTVGLRAATGLQHLYVTVPARREYQTPENELLVFVLDAIVVLGRETGWHQSAVGDVGTLVASRVADAERWRQSRMLSEVERRPITATKLARIRNGRRRRRYQAALDAYERYATWVSRLDREAVRRAVESSALLVKDDATLFELLCVFRLIEELRSLGWHSEAIHVVEGAFSVRWQRHQEALDLFYQHTPADLGRNSIYGTTLRKHSLRVGGLIPDAVIRHARASGVRWLLIEMKGGAGGVPQLARRALLDLLGYRRALDPILNESPAPYGLGIAWGEDLEHAEGTEVLLATPDTLGRALRAALDHRAEQAGQ
jgi:hypothetical protein